MTINYCDYENGNDSTGDGTHGNPYKTINQASTGLTGDDEVRVAKSVDDSDLSGTLAFVNGSVSITTSVDLTGSLVAGDFIYKTGESDFLNEVISLTSSVLSLFKSYPGTTETVTGKKLGITCTGEATQFQQIQAINSSGTSDVSRLKISGGWDLSTQTQTGYTYFQQLHTTQHNRYGYGLNCNNKNYIEIEKIGVLRYYRGTVLDASHHNILNLMKFNNNGQHGIYIYNSDHNTVNSSISKCNTTNGIGLYDSNNNILNDNINEINLHGLNFYGSDDNIVNNMNCNYNSTNGFILSSSNNLIVNNINCNNNAVGIQLSSSNNCEINDPICNYNSATGINLNYSDNCNFNNVDCNNGISGIICGVSNSCIFDTVNCENNQHGININGGSKNIFNNVNCDNNDQTGCYFDSNTNNNTINSISCNNGVNSGIGIEMDAAYNNKINNATSNENLTGLEIKNGRNNIFNNVICNNNHYHGVNMDDSFNNSINGLTCNNNGYASGYYGVKVIGVLNLINNYSCSGNNSGNVLIDTWDYFQDESVLDIQHINIIGDNRSYFEYGITYRDTAEARSTQCLRFEPTSNLYYIMHNFNFTALNNIEKIISFYIKDDATFDGDVQAALYFMGVNITGWSNIIPTLNYVRNSLIANAANITEDGVLELKIKVRGTTGNVYVDDLGVI